MTSNYPRYATIRRVMEPRFEFKLTSKLWVLNNSTSKVSYS